MIAVGGIHKAMREIAAQKGDFTLFALLRRSEPLYGMWDLVVAAPWLKGGTLARTKQMADLLSRSIGTKGLQQLARIVVVSDDNPTVKFFLKNVPVEDGERAIQSTDLFGMQIEEAIVMRAKRPERPKPRARVAHPALSGSPQPARRQRALART
jgi:hypothetical protein